ncbi:MAG: hypothetical protein KC800_25735 [Candidatus Eremiobacteraeota bacterium]|nr:hypothetical protein [Candidatus Eremiobacteraeota bacterium]
MITTFEDLEEFVTRKLRHVRQQESIRESLDTTTATESDQLREAVSMLFTAGEQSKIYKEIRDACSDFLKYALPEGEHVFDGYKVNHYNRNVFDKAAWEHACQTDEGLQELWAYYQEYETTKKKLKPNFQYIDSSIRVTPEGA